MSEHICMKYKAVLVSACYSYIECSLKTCLYHTRSVDGFFHLFFSFKFDSTLVCFSLSVHIESFHMYSWESHSHTKLN